MTLLEECKTGNRKAQYAIYQQYSRAMFNVCIRMTNNREEAEDILQEAFLKAFLNIRSFKGEATFGAWLKRIVVNESINHMKKRRLPLFNIEEMPLPEPPVAEPDDTTLDINRIREAIQLLPDGYRVVFTLYLIEGYDHTEIAQVLDISESASKSQYSRAKAKLRQILKQAG